MTSMKTLIAATIALLASAGLALAQVPQVQAIGQADLVPIIPGGQPSAPSVFAPAGAVGSMQSYSYQVPLTAFAITVPNLTGLLYLNPAGTLATGALTMMANASDGQIFCLEDTQVQTALTISANTGQTMLTSIGLGALTALAANTRYCWFYNKPLAGWIRTQ